MESRNNKISEIQRKRMTGESKEAALQVARRGGGTGGWGNATFGPSWGGDEGARLHLARAAGEGGIGVERNKAAAVRGAVV